MIALPWIAMGLAAAGTGVSMAGQLKKAAYEKSMADLNARVAGENSTAAALRGMAEREQLMIQGSQVIGRQRAGAGSGGASVTSGSIVDTIAATRAASTLDLLRSEYGTEMERRGFGVQASNFRAQGEMASLAGAYGAASSLLSGLGSIAGSAYAMKGSGGSPNVSEGSTGTPYALARPGSGYDPLTFPSFGVGPGGF